MNHHPSQGTNDAFGREGYGSRGSMSAEENHRMFFRVNFHYPLAGFLTVDQFYGKCVDLGETRILIENIGLGGLCFLSALNFGVDRHVILKIRTKLFGETIEMLGSVVWREMLAPSFLKYGLEFVITEHERSALAQTLNKLTLQLRKRPTIPDCSFVTTNKKGFLTANYDSSKHGFHF